MKTTMHAVNPQGLAHPQFSQSWLLTPFVDTIGLCSLAQRGTFNFVNGLDTRLQSWWTRHPQAMTYLGQFELSTLYRTDGVSGHVLPVWAAWIGSQRKRPQLAFLDTHCRAATQSTLVIQNLGTIQMIYTFLIAGGCQKLSDLKRIRTITVTAQTEAKARKQLLGLPLVFISQSPVMEVAA